MTGSWEPDPTGRHQYRWWDGQAWTDHVADGGRADIDPVGVPVEPAPTTATGPIPTSEPPATGTPAQGGTPSEANAAATGPNHGVIAVVVAAVVVLVGAGAFLVLDGDDDDTTTGTSAVSTTGSTVATSTTSASSTTAPATTTTVTSTTTGTRPGAEPGSIGADESTRFPLELQDGQAFRFRVDDAPGSQADVVVSIVGPTDRVVAAAQTSSALTGQSADQILDLLGSQAGVDVPGVGADETVIFQTDRSYVGEADWWIAPFAGEVALVVSEYSGQPAEFTVVIEPGDVTDADIFLWWTDPAALLENPQVQGQFFTDTNFYR